MAAQLLGGTVPEFCQCMIVVPLFPSTGSTRLDVLGEIKERPRLSCSQLTVATCGFEQNFFVRVPQTM